MCELYVKADPILYESRSRSLRIRGVVTTLRLENQFWDILREIAEVDGMTTNQLIAKLYDEIWVYGLADFADPLHGVACPAAVREKMIYTGYLRRAVIARWAEVRVSAALGGPSSPARGAALTVLDGVIADPSAWLGAAT